MADRSQGKARRGLRRLAIAMLAVVAGVAALIAAGSLALRSPDFRQRILVRADGWTHQNLGLRFGAEDFELRPLAGSLRLRDVVLGDAGVDREEQAFARLPEIGVSFSPWSVLRLRLRIRELVLETPVLDLSRAMALSGRQRQSGAAGGAPPELGVSIDRLAIRGGEIVELPAPEPVTAAAVRGIDLDGRLTKDRFELELARATLLLRVEGLAPFEAVVAAQGSVGLDLAWVLDELEIAGESIDLHLDGAAGPGGRRPRTRLELSLDLPRLLGVEAAAPELKARGALDLENGIGNLSLEALDQMLALLRPLVAAGLYRDLSLARTRADLTAELEWERGRGGGGRIDLEARQLAETVASIEARPSIGADLRGPLEVTFELELLPAAAGRRVVSGTAHTPAATRLPEAELTDGRFALEAPEIRATARELARRWPSLVESYPALGRALDLPGSLQASGALSGRLTDPLVEGTLSWQPAAAAEILVEGEGRPLSHEGQIRTRGDAVPLAALAVGAAGELSWSAALSRLGGRLAGSLDLAGQALSFGPDGPIGEELGLRAGIEGRRVLWEATGAVSTTGRFEASGDLGLELPLATATARIGLLEPLGGVERMDLALELAAGVLELEVSPESEIAGAEGALTARLPLADWAAVVPVLQTIPLQRSPGETAITWDLMGGDWARLSEAAGGPILERLQAASRGQIRFEPARPAMARGRAEITALEIERLGRRWEGDGPLVLEIADGLARLGPWRLTGETDELRLAGSVGLEPAWRLGDPWRSLVGRLEVGAEIDLPVEHALALVPAIGVGADRTAGGLAIEADLSGPLENLEGRLTVAGDSARLGLDGLALGRPRLEVLLNGGELRLDGDLAVNDGDLRIEGRTRLEEPLTNLEATVVAIRPFAGVEHVELAAVAGAEALEIDSRRVEIGGGTGRMTARLPWSLLARSRESPVGVLTADWEFSEIDWGPLLQGLGTLEEPLQWVTSGRGRLEMPLDEPRSAVGELELDRLEIVVADRRSSLAQTMRLDLADGKARLQPFRLSTAGQPFEVEGGFTLGRSESPWIDDLSLSARGKLDSALLNPFLLGGVAQGLIGLDLVVSGPLVALEGRARLDGEGASVLFVSPYLTRFESPQLDLELAEGRVEIEQGSLRLNEGSATLGGWLTPQGEMDLTVTMEDVSYRVDYGLLLRIDGDLRLAGSLDAVTASGELLVERGVLTRSIDVDLDFLSELLAPVDLTTTEEDPFDLVALDLTIATRDGVRIRNNVADLVARWQPLAVGGSLAAPIVEGMIEVDPGGLIHAYGQTVRLDRASLEYTGEPGVEAILDLETTSSLEDPSISQLAGNDLLVAEFAMTEAAAEGGQTAGDRDGGEGGRLEAAAETLTTGLATYLGERLAASLSESLGGTRISLRPVLIFGETDPGARLTLSRDFSQTVSLAASLDLRNAENQTYILDVHRLRHLPQFNGQIFTDDQDERGVAARQTLEFGGAPRRAAGESRRLAKLRVERLPGFSRRGLRRAIGLTRGDDVEEEEIFAVEVEAVEYLRGRGYPDARVEVAVEPRGSSGRSLDLRLTVAPGPRVEYVFAGDQPPKRLRGSITSLYRSDFYQDVALDEMRLEAVRVFRSKGFLDPEVAIDVATMEAAAGGYQRRVTVHTTAGIQIEPGPPRFVGVSEEEAALVARRFPSPVQRVELAMGVAEADRRVLSSLAMLGYLDPAIVTRYSSIKGDELTVELTASGRRRIAELRLEGLEATEEARLLGSMALAVGDPARGDELALAALAIESDLKGNGFADARVLVRTEEAAGDPREITVIYAVERNELVHLTEVSLDGLRATRERWAAGAAGLEEGSLFAAGKVSLARSNLFSTGLFSSVTADWSADQEGQRAVRLEVEERPRFQLAYGLRWESGDDGGAGAVVDFTNRNLGGRGLTLGLRALYSDERQSVRGVLSWPRFLSGRGTLSLFAVADELRSRDNDLTETLETTIQYSLPYRRHSVFRVYGRYKDRHLSEIDPDPFFPFDVRITSPLFGFQYLFDSRAAVALPERGVLATLDLSGADRFLGSDFSWLRLYGQFNLHRPLGAVGSRRLLWSSSYRMGLAEALRDQIFKLDERFFAGGGYSVRGYDDESLGPAEDLGPSLINVLGGQALLVINQQLRLALSPSLSGVVFFDAGNVWAKPEDLDLDLLKSVGVGLRAVTPFGLFRLDIARPLDRRELDSEWKIHLGFGDVF